MTRSPLDTLLRAGLFAVPIVLCAWLVNQQLSPTLDLAIIVGATLLAFPAVWLGRTVLDREPTVARAGRITVFVHVSMMILLGAAVVRAIATHDNWPGWTLPVPTNIGWLLVVVTGVPALLSVVNLALRGLGAPFALALSQRLATDWMYAWTRNPMVLFSLSCLLALGIWYQSALFVLWAVFLVSPALLAFVKLYEERELEIRFGAPYLEYKAKTPMLIPRPPGC